MHVLCAGTYIRPVRGENADGITSFAPVDEGQIPCVTFPKCVSFDGSAFGLPLLRSYPLAQFAGSNISADRSSPVVRSRTYTNPVRPGWIRSFRCWPP